MTHYVVTPDGRVRSYKQKAVALAMVRQLGESAAYACVNGDTEDLSKLSTPMLVTLHNLARPERPVARFADRATAEKRIKGVLEVLAKPGEAPTEVAGEIQYEQTEIPGTEAPSEATTDSETAEFTTTETSEASSSETSSTEEETTKMARATKSARKGAAKKGAKKTTTPREVKSIPESTVRRVIKMRETKNWPEILKELGESNNFIHRVRPLMKKLDKSSVLAIGPGSPNYGKNAGKKVAVRKSGK